MAEKENQRLVEGVWICPWFGKISDALEPWLFLPGLIMSVWLFILLEPWILLHKAIVLAIAAILVTLSLPLFCVLWVWFHGKDNESGAERSPQAS